MTGEAWVFLIAATVTGVLLTIAIAGNAHLAAENRRLRSDNDLLRAIRRARRTAGGAA